MENLSVQHEDSLHDGMDVNKLWDVTLPESSSCSAPVNPVTLPLQVGFFLWMKVIQSSKVVGKIRGQVCGHVPGAKQMSNK